MVHNLKLLSTTKNKYTLVCFILDGSGNFSSLSSSVFCKCNVRKLTSVNLGTQLSFTTQATITMSQLCTFCLFYVYMCNTFPTSLSNCLWSWLQRSAKMSLFNWFLLSSVILQRYIQYYCSINSLAWHVYILVKVWLSCLSFDHMFLGRHPPKIFHQFKILYLSTTPYVILYPCPRQILDNITFCPPCDSFLKFLMNLSTLLIGSSAVWKFVYTCLVYLLRASVQYVFFFYYLHKS